MDRSERRLCRWVRNRSNRVGLQAREEMISISMMSQPRRRRTFVRTIPSSVCVASLSLGTIWPRFRPPPFHMLTVRAVTPRR
jgi:hypothetical protein